MPEYPTAAVASILTDIRLFSSDLQSLEGSDLVIRTEYNPTTNTCTVSAYAGNMPGGQVGKCLAYRVIFTGERVPDEPISQETAEDVPQDVPPVPPRMVVRSQINDDHTKDGPGTLVARTTFLGVLPENNS